ncbi:MAG: hypothetical protein KA251_10740 [Saprospiraceae bacterium]|nr:hypothetical protein [Saprospiraceae bacterium]
MKRKILLIGPLPPPAGGVSVHVLRLSEKINSTNDFECAVFDIGRLKFYNKKFELMNVFRAVAYFISASIIHFHISHPKKYFIAKLAKMCGKKIIYTRHNIREEHSIATARLHEISDAAILVYNSSMKTDLKTKIIPAFIPSSKTIPLDDQIKKQLANYNSLVVAISTHPKNGKMIIGEGDLYGFDLLLDSFPGFYQTGQALVLVDGNGSMKAEYSKKVAKLNNEGFPVIYLTSDIDFNALLPLVSIYVRPTRSDGDSLAIREALGAGVKVLASDCVTRPEGTALFKVNDALSLTDEMKKLMDIPKIKPSDQFDFSKNVLEVYMSLG